MTRLPATLNKNRFFLALKKTSRFEEGIGTVCKVSDMREISIASHFKRLMGRGVNFGLWEAAKTFCDSMQFLFGSIVDNVVQASAHLEHLRRRQGEGVSPSSMFNGPSLA